MLGEMRGSFQAGGRMFRAAVVNTERKVIGRGELADSSDDR